MKFNISKKKSAIALALMLTISAAGGAVFASSNGNKVITKTQSAGTLKDEDLSKIKKISEAEVEKIIKELDLENGKVDISGENSDFKIISINGVENIDDLELNGENFKDGKVISINGEDLNKTLLEKKVITQEEADRLKATEEKMNELLKGTEKFFEDGKLDEEEKNKLDEVNKKVEAIMSQDEDIHAKIAKNLAETEIAVKGNITQSK